MSYSWNVDLRKDGGEVEVDQGARLRLQEAKLEYVEKKGDST